MPKKQRVFKYLRDAGFAIVIIIGITFWQNRDLLPSNEKAPDFSAVMLDGQNFTSASLRGKSTLVYFFSPWCGICRISANSIVDLLETLGTERLQVVAVAVDYETHEHVADFAKEAGIEPVPIVLANDEIRAQHHVNEYPTYYGINSNGIVVFRSVGYTSFLGLLIRSWVFL